MAETPDAAAPAAEGKKKRKINQLRPKARKKLKAANDSSDQLTPEEKQRRQEQKRQRELALKLRAEGRSYDPKVFKRKKQQKDGGKHPKAKVKIKSSQRNKAPYNVIILPIAWHQRKEESARILAASEKAQELLQAAGVTCRIDDGDKFSPGQKMKYWELRGVCVRLEIGPKESLAGTAVLAVAAATPGQVASKSSVKLAEPGLTQRVKQALQQLGEQLGVEQTDDAQPLGREGRQLQQQQDDARAEQAADDAALRYEQGEQQLKNKKQKKDSALSEVKAAGDVTDTTSSKAGKKQKDRKELKAQLASLMAEQQMTEDVMGQVEQEAANGKQQQQPEATTGLPAEQQRRQQLSSGDALDDDFDMVTEDIPTETKKTGKKTDQKGKKKAVKEGQHAVGAGDVPQPGKVKKAKVVKF